MAHQIKYPSTPHLPWSRPGEDDTYLADLSTFEGDEVVITEKLDGENANLYADHYHARSIDSRHHPSRSMIKAFHASIAHLIPNGWRLCGENVYAQHSIRYENLESYFYLFSVWNEHNHALPWDETRAWAHRIGAPTPTEFYRGTWDEAFARELVSKLDSTRVEGYVVRTVHGFPYAAFGQHVAKYVRPNHVQTSQHWMHGPVIPNRLAEE